MRFRAAICRGSARQRHGRSRSAVIRCQPIELDLGEDNVVTVRDNGRFIPSDIPEIPRQIGAE